MDLLESIYNKSPQNESIYNKSLKDENYIQACNGKKNNKAPDDMLTMLCDFISLFNYKVGFFLFIIYILLNSTVFYFQLINKISVGSYDIIDDKLTEKGLIIIGLLLVGSYLILDVLSKTDYI